MKNLINILTFNILLVFLAACTESMTKAGYIQNYETWIFQLKKDYKGYKESDWVQAEVEFKKFSETEYIRFKDDLTPVEIQRIDILSGQYYALVFKYQCIHTKDELNSMFNKAKGMIDELQND